MVRHNEFAESSGRSLKIHGKTFKRILFSLGNQRNHTISNRNTKIKLFESKHCHCHVFFSRLKQRIYYMYIVFSPFLQRIQDFGSGGLRGNGSEGVPVGGCRGACSPSAGVQVHSPWWGLGQSPRKFVKFFIDFSLKINFKIRKKSLKIK